MTVSRRPIEVDRDGQKIEVKGDARVTSKDGDSDKWKSAVQSAMERNNPGKKDGYDYNGLRFVVVQEGDNQWEIAKKLGVSWKDMVAFNRFEDDGRPGGDDLIRPGEVIVVPQPKPEDAAALSGNKDKSGKRPAVDAFARSLADRAGRAAATGSNAEWDSIKADASTYLDKIEGNDEAFFELVAHPDLRGDTSQVRTDLVEIFLKKKPEKVEGKPDWNPRQEAFNALLDKNRKWGSDGEKIKADIRNAGAKLRLQVPG